MPSHPQDNSLPRSWVTYTALVFASVVVVSFATYILRNYYIKAYSDPLNWLSYATDLSERYSSSKWPVGYPVFLRLVMSAVGPYYVFLSNMVVLLALATLVAVAAAKSAGESESRLNSFLVGIGCFAMLLNFDYSFLVYLTNPYRDPLSFLLMIAASLLVSRYVDSRGQKTASLAFGGLLLGWAYCVRETSILMIIPLFIFGADAWRRNRDIGFWKSCLTFGSCLLLGALPLLIQSYSSTGQALLPPQSALSDAVLPGLHVSTQKRTLARAFQYFWRADGWLYLSGAAAGVCAALVMRCRRILYIFIPGMAVFFIFYSYYEYFVRRYFYVVVVLLMPVAAYGIYLAVAALLNLLGAARVKTQAFLLVTGVLCVMTSVTLLSAKPEAPQFRIPEARHFTADMNTFFPEDSFVLSNRHLNEALDFFVHVDSTPCNDLCFVDRINAGEIREGVERLLERYRDVYVVTPSAREGFDPCASMISSMYTLTKTAEFAPDTYRLRRRIYGAEMAEVYRVSRWQENETSQIADPPTGETPLLRIDAGYLWEHSESRSFAELYYGGNLLDEKVESGINFYWLDESYMKKSPRLVLKSDQPVRPLLDPVFLNGKDPIQIDFGEKSRPSFSKLLSGDFFRGSPSGSDEVRALRERGRILVPTPWKTDDQWVFAEFTVRAASRMNGASLAADFRNDAGHLLRRASVPADGLGHLVSVPLSSDTSEVDSIAVEITLKKAPDLPMTFLPIMDFARMVVRPVPKTPEIEVALGSEDDSTYLVSGFYKSEKYKNGHLFRWTGPRAELDLRPLERTGDLQLKVSLIPKARPKSVGEGNLTAMLNGRVLEWDSSGAEGPFLVYRAEVDADLVSADENVLVLSSEAWTPADFGSGDTRQLGVMVHKVAVTRR